MWFCRVGKKNSLKERQDGTHLSKCIKLVSLLLWYTANQLTCEYVIGVSPKKEDLYYYHPFLLFGTRRDQPFAAHLKISDVMQSIYINLTIQINKCQH